MFDAYTIAFGIRNVTDIDKALRRGAPRAQVRRAVLLPRILDHRVAGLQRCLRRLFAQASCRKLGKAIARRRGQLSLPRRIDPPLPDDGRVRGDDRRGGLRADQGRADPGRARRDPFAAGRSETDDPPLDAHLAAAQMGPHAGAARRAARDRARPEHPAPVAPAGRIARFGASHAEDARLCRRVPGIGPAAIKLGQTLATRPDLVGEEAAREPAALQDALPPVPFEADPRGDRRAASSGRSSDLFAAIDPVPVGAASIAQVHRAVTTDGRDVAVKVLRPGIEERFARDDRHLSNGPPRRSRRWAASCARLRPRLVDRQLQALDRRASSTCGARPPRPPSSPRAMPRARGYCIVPRSTGTAPTAG